MSKLRTLDNNLSPGEFQRTVTGEIGTKQLNLGDRVDLAILEVRQQMQDKFDEISQRAKVIKKLKKDLQGSKTNAQGQTDSTLEEKIWSFVDKIAAPVEKILTPIFKFIDSIPKKCSKN